MEVHQLRYLVAVTEERSFTTAAQRLHVSQSAVSAQLAKLERELGQQLLDRTTREVAVTPFGKAVLPLAREALAAFEAITYTAQEFADAVRGSVGVGMITGCAIPGFLDAVADLRRTHPRITLRLHEDDSRVMQSLVRDRVLDLALIGYGGTLDPDLESVVTTEDRLVAVSAAAPARAVFTLERLQREQVLCMQPGTGIRAAYEKSCHLAGLEPRVDIEASSPATLLGLAARGVGYAVLAESSVAAGGVAAVPIADARVPASLALIRRPDRNSPAARVVFDALARALKGEVPTS